MSDVVDVAIIGGGINGCGIARDCAKRGLSVALFERNDFGAGATWASSGMIHGGLRYLSSDPEVTRRSCEDSGNIQRIANHLIFRIPFLMAFRGSDPKAQTLLPAAEIYFQTYDRYAPLKGGKASQRLTGAEAKHVEPGLVGDVVGAVTTDEWGIDAARLTLLNALDAVAHGAEIHNHTDVIEVLRDGDTVLGIDVKDRHSGARRQVRASVVMNATGAWGGRFLRSQGVDGLSLRPAKGIHLIYPGRLTNYAVVSQAVDGRQIFVCPHQNVTLVGTTDDDYYGDMDDVPVLEDEVAYLIEGAAHIFPSIREHQFIETKVGCRPTLHQYGRSEDDLRRHHAVVNHEHNGARGLLSIAGGKLAAYRLMAADATDAIFGALGRRAPACTTHRDPLPGAEAHDESLRPLMEGGLSSYAASRVMARHGARSDRVVQLLREHPAWARPIDASEGICEAELRATLRDEYVGKLSDLRLRLRLGGGPDLGARSALPAAQVFCDERGLSPSAALDVARQFHEARRRRTAPVPPRRPNRPAQHTPELAPGGVLVVGSGIAGVAAALSAHGAGAAVQMATHRPGGTALWRGRLTGGDVPPILAPFFVAGHGSAVTEAGRVVPTSGGSVPNAVPPGPLTWVDTGASAFDPALSARAAAEILGVPVHVLRVTAVTPDAVADAEGTLLLPPLGRDVAAARSLHAALGRPCVERVAEVSPAPGLRLWRSLQAAVDGFGVHRGPVAVRADEWDAVILATGRFLTGGLVEGPPLREPLCDLPLTAGPAAIDRGTTRFQFQADDVRAHSRGSVHAVGSLAHGGASDTICLDMLAEAIRIGAEVAP